MAESGKPPARRSRSSARSKESADNGPGEFLESEDVRTGLITGATFHAKPVQYIVRDGLALFEGDIVLGTEEEMDQRTEELRSVMRGELESGVLRTGAQFRWPNCVVPFTIDAALPNQAGSPTRSRIGSRGRGSTSSRGRARPTSSRFAREADARRRSGAREASSSSTSPPGARRATRSTRSAMSSGSGTSRAARTATRS